MTKLPRSIPFRQIWYVAIAVGVLVALPLAFFAHQAPGTIAIPIGLGVLVLVYSELVGDQSPGDLNKQDDLFRNPSISVPGYFVGLAKFGGHVALTRSVDEPQPDQQTFAFLDLPRRKAAPAVRLIRDPDTGERVFLLDTEKFVAHTMRQYLPQSEKAAEMALLRALHRFGEMESLSPDLEKFLRSKSVIESIRADFRGNASQALGGSSEAACRELIREFRKTKQGQLVS